MRITGACRLLLALTIGASSGCGEEAAPSQGLGDVSIQPVDSAGGGNVDGQGGGEAPTYVVTSQPVQIQSGGRTVHITKWVPSGCDAATPCPAVVLVPDGIQGGDEFFGDTVPEVLAGSADIIVVRYNPPGRGIGSFKSEGVEDYNGKEGQDALKDVLLALDKNQDTSDAIGVISFGYGLTAAAGALARYQPTNLKFVDWLIDVEGPINRCYVTEHPSDPAAGITGDGIGISDGHCDLGSFDINRGDAFPTSIEPKSLICNKKAFPVSLTGKGCEDEQWWADREARSFLKKLKGAYLRIQMRYDHRQPARTSALLALYYAIQSPDLEYKQLNDVKANEPVHTWGDAPCLEAGCFLSNKELGNSIAFPVCSGLDCKTPENPYKGVMSGYRAMSLRSFAEKILPKYVARLNDRS